MRLLVVLLSGCAFTAPDLDPATGEDGDDGDGSGSGDPVVVRSCRAPAPADLRLCIDFEDPSLAQHALDGSGRLNDALATLVSATPRGTEQAAKLGDLSGLHVAETDALDLAAYTIEMWIRPDAMPLDGTEYGLLENTDQYTMGLESDGAVRCALAGTQGAASRARVPLGTWRHLACRYDGENMRVYVNGDVAGCSDLDATVATAPTNGTSIGARMTAGAYRDSLRGALDNVRVYSGAIDPQRLCAGAGRATCETRCPAGGGGPGPP